MTRRDALRTLLALAASPLLSAPSDDQPAPPAAPLPPTSDYEPLGLVRVGHAPAQRVRSVTVDGVQHTRCVAAHDGEGWADVYHGDVDLIHRVYGTVRFHTEPLS
jgi:hypothetical protein